MINPNEAIDYIIKHSQAYAKAKAAQSTLEDIAAKQNKLLVERADLLDEFSKKNIKSFKDEATYTEDGIRLMSEYDKEVIRRINLLKENNLTVRSIVDKTKSSIGTVMKLKKIIESDIS
jgi:hypothetical protein